MKKSNKKSKGYSARVSIAKDFANKKDALKFIKQYEKNANDFSVYKKHNY